jgi:hypothetical protein
VVTIERARKSPVPRPSSRRRRGVDNASSFTKLGNLLYIDARQTGFSYDDAPGYPCTFDMQEDSIDFTRVILRVLDTHPQLTASRVVLVGESYGGARAAADPAERAPLHAGPGDHERGPAASRYGLRCERRASYFGYGASNGSWAVDTTLVPTAFVDNLSHVRTLITNATFDGIVDTTQIAPALVAFGVPATLDQAPRSEGDRPGWIDVTLPGDGSATIRLRAYPAGHMVTATDAADLRTDTADWLGL